MKMTDQDLLDFVGAVMKEDREQAVMVLFGLGRGVVESGKLVDLCETLRVDPCVDCEERDEGYTDGQDSKQGELDDAEADIDALKGDKDVLIDEIGVLKTAISKDLTTIRDLEDKIADLTKGDQPS